MAKPAKDRPPERLPRRHEFLVSPNDYLNDPNVLGKGTEFRGVYSTLWLNSWNMPEPGVIPADPEVLREVAKATPEEWARQSEAVSRCFDTTSRPGFWIQKRVAKEHRRQLEQRKKAVSQGRYGAELRWGRHRGAIATPMPNDSGSYGSKGSRGLVGTSKNMQEGHAVGPSARCLTGLQKRFPNLDLPVIEAKMLAHHAKNPYRNLDRAMISWCQMAEKNGWDPKVNGPPRMTPEEWAREEK